MSLWVRMNNALQYTQNKHLIACPKVRDIICLLWNHHMIHAVISSSRCCTLYLGVIGRVIWRSEWAIRSGVVCCLLSFRSYRITSTYIYDNSSLSDTLPLHTVDIHCIRGIWWIVCFCRLILIGIIETMAVLNVNIKYVYSCKRIANFIKPYIDGNTALLISRTTSRRKSLQVTVST